MQPPATGILQRLDVADSLRVGNREVSAVVWDGSTLWSKGLDRNTYGMSAQAYHTTNTGSGAFGVRGYLAFASTTTDGQISTNFSDIVRVYVLSMRVSNNANYNVNEGYVSGWHGPMRNYAGDLVVAATAGHEDAPDNYFETYGNVTLEGNSQNRIVGVASLSNSNANFEVLTSQDFYADPTVTDVWPAADSYTNKIPFVTGASFEDAGFTDLPPALG